MEYSASLAEEVAGVLAATVPLGMPSGKTGNHPGWKPLQGSAAIMSQARLHARAGSPDPSEGTCKLKCVILEMRVVPAVRPEGRRGDEEAASVGHGFDACVGCTPPITKPV